MANSIMLGGGNPLTISGLLALLYKQTSGTVTPLPTPSAPMPITGMAGWWDASSLNWGQVYNTLTDSSKAGVAASTGGAKAVAHLAGMLGGLYPETSYWSYPYNFSYLHPFISNYAVSANNVHVGTGGAFTIFLVWSRANQPQQASAASTASAVDVPLVNINGTTVLSMTSRGDGTDSLKLFPSGTTQTIGNLELRHTHCIRMVYNGTSVDLWLDNKKLTTATTTQLGSQVNLSFLNGAQCIFHEAACWSHNLSDSENSDLSGYANRWPLGPRQAVNGVIIGQSNMGNLIGGGNFIQIYHKVAYLTGCLSTNILFVSGTYANIPSAGSTIWSGQGLYDLPNTALFLDPSLGGTAATWTKDSKGNPVCPWPLGPNGKSMCDALDAMTPDQKANLYYIARFWSESDSAMLKYTMKATYLAACKKEMALIRQHLNKTAAELPYFVINALPFGNFDEGCQTHREVMADLVADPDLNVHFMLTQSCDAIGQNDGWDQTTGIESGGGNGAHRDNGDYSAYAYRFAIPIAREVMKAQALKGKSDVITKLDDSLPQGVGPSILSAKYEGTAYQPTGSVLVTISHDKGTDLIVPLRAALGVGWSLMDGVSDTTTGTPGTPGRIINGTSCVRLSSNQLRVTLASLPSHPSKSQMYYAYGCNLDSNQMYAIIGRGNAVTDNLASVTLSAGWQIANDMNDSLAQANMPLQASTYGMPISM